MDIVKTLATEFNIKEEQVEKTIELIDEGNTIPFISRYRKEVTGSLDDSVLRDLNDRLQYLRKLDERRAEISSLIEAQEKLTPEITFALNNATTLVELEDIYLPYKPKRKTRASVARAKGLEPLANYILEQRDSYEVAIDEYAKEFISEEEGKEVPDAAAALQGASDIIAEDISNNAEIRKLLREFTMGYGALTTKGTTEETSVYENYYDFSEPIKKLKGHRVLAINRGEKEEFLKVAVTLPEEDGIAQLVSKVITNKQSPALPYLMETIKDAYDRLLFPAIEREVRTTLFDDASEGAIKVFSENLRNLLLVSPIKGKTVLGYDPGYGHGCKLAVVDKTGKVMDTAVIYPFRSKDRVNEDDLEKSKAIVLRLVKKNNVDVISIGNGTASRESEKFIAERVIRDPECPKGVKYTIVSEAGASVYSASKLATEEFPDFDVMQRSAISIARRLQDPLAELVKIEPKAIGVGQYQHDMKQARLTEALGGVVEDCVNGVGVDINTASYSLLSYVSGINLTAAKNIVAYREEYGEFKSRKQILKVPKIGDKAFTQCAGFLRIPGADEVFDSTGVHPESYAIAEDLLKRFGFTTEDVRNNNLALLKFKVSQYGLAKLAGELGCGAPTLEDIIGELEKPGRDIRDDAPAPILSTDVLDINDLKPDMQLNGTVRNVVDFGCFVDIGVHHDGLLHISEMSDRYIKHPSELFKTGDIIEVRIKDVDVAKHRISLTRKGMGNPKK
ncbi:MAG: RNA-binding transcriptional accessory protein [Ruminococcaceae bacterium]|nr:RNA-binding transcriptional accessory protein [Oscillospiraceae bacterium]